MDVPTDCLNSKCGTWDDNGSQLVVHAEPPRGLLAQGKFDIKEQEDARKCPAIVGFFLTTRAASTSEKPFTLQFVLLPFPFEYAKRRFYLVCSLFIRSTSTIARTNVLSGRCLPPRNAVVMSKARPS